MAGSLKRFTSKKAKIAIEFLNSPVKGKSLFDSKKDMVA